MYNPDFTPYGSLVAGLEVAKHTSHPIIMFTNKKKGSIYRIETKKMETNIGKSLANQ
jgi:hypothetical protein